MPPKKDDEAARATAAEAGAAADTPLPKPAPAPAPTVPVDEFHGQGGEYEIGADGVRRRVVEPTRIGPLDV
ncbi:MAG TPA: hypothetical protein PKD73_06105 [Burkholderiaceae bacterium]|nr:hypothetical protein [Burkholderiaceae bacterium]